MTQPAASSLASICWRARASGVMRSIPRSAPARVAARPAHGNHRLRMRRMEAERNGAPGGIRTPDQWLRKPLLYPAELRARGAARPRTERCDPRRTGSIAEMGRELALSE